MTFREEILRLFKVEKPVGYTAEEVEKAKSAAGGLLPLELERFYLYCGKSPEIRSLQDEFILPNRYSAFLKLDYIVFFNENQGVCQAAVKKSDAALDDPPVYVSVGDDWRLSSPRFSEFIRAMYDYQASISLDFSPEEFYFISAEEKKKIENLFPKLGEFNNWLYDFKISVFGENGGRVALMENGGDIQMNYAANNEDEFKRMAALLNGIGEPI